MRWKLREQRAFVLGFKEGKIFSEKLGRDRIQGRDQKEVVPVLGAWVSGPPWLPLLWVGWFLVPQSEKKPSRTNFKTKDLGEYVFLILSQ